MGFAIVLSAVGLVLLANVLRVSDRLAAAYRPLPSWARNVGADQAATYRFWGAVLVGAGILTALLNR